MAVTDETCIAKIYAGPIHYALGIRAANRPCVGHHQKYESDTKLFVCLLSRVPGADRMKTADALMVIYYVVLSGVLVFTLGYLAGWRHAKR
jgi:hypothetical protein